MGRSLLICALNQARIRIFELDEGTAGAGQQARPVYFEALLPVSDAASESLAATCEMLPVDEAVLQGMRLYRCEM